MHEVRLAIAMVGVCGSIALAGAAPPPTQSRAVPDMDIVEEPVRPRRPPPPTPAPDVAAHAQGLLGTWACSATNMSAALDLDNAWLVFVTAGRVTYRSYDPVAKLWTQYTMTRTGESLTETSAGEVNGEWVFGNAGVRDHEKRGADGTLARWGEVNVNGRWVKTYEMACAK